VFGAWAVQLGRDANWDLQNYHWYNAYAILYWRYDRDVAPAMGQTFFSPLLYVPWYLLGIALPARAMGFVIAAVQSVNLLLLYGIALTTLPIQRALHREFASLAIAAAGMCGGMSLGLLGTTFIDSVVSIGLLGSMLAVVAGREALVSAGPSQAAWRAALAAVPAALAIAGKLSVAPFAVGLAAGFLAIEGPFRRRLWLLCWFGIGGALTAAITLGPWLIQVWSMTGAPFYPFYASYFHSPFAGGAWNFDIWKPHGVAESLVYPILIAFEGARVAEVPFTDFRLAAAFVLVPLALVVRQWPRSMQRRPLPGGFSYLLLSMAVSYVLWLLLFSYYRYAVTLELLAPLAIALALATLPLAGWLRAFVIAAVVTGLVVTTRPADWGHLPWTQRFIEVSVPPISNPETAAVLMMGQPISYVVPSLPPQVAVIDLEMAYWDGGNQEAWARLIRARLADRSGAGYAILFAGREQQVGSAAAPFGLFLDAARCQSMPTNLPSAGLPAVQSLVLCALERSSASRP
jgi:hypothetical protein